MSVFFFLVGPRKAVWPFTTLKATFLKALKVAECEFAAFNLMKGRWHQSKDQMFQGLLPVAAFFFRPLSSGLDHLFIRSCSSVPWWTIGLHGLRLVCRGLSSVSCGAD